MATCMPNGRQAAGKAFKYYLYQVGNIGMFYRCNVIVITF
jgi:hypothetical protein